MRMRSRLICVVLALVVATVLGPDVAYAYGGPGSIISGIGALLAAVAAIGAAIFGFLWFPAKRLLKKIRSRKDKEVVEAEV